MSGWKTGQKEGAATSSVQMEGFNERGSLPATPRKLQMGSRREDQSGSVKVHEENQSSSERPKVVRTASSCSELDNMQQNTLKEKEKQNRDHGTQSESQSMREANSDKESHSDKEKEGLSDKEGFSDKEGHSDKESLDSISSSVPLPFDLKSLRNVKTMDELMQLAPKRQIKTIPLNEAKAKFGAKDLTVSEISNTLISEAAQSINGRKMTQEAVNNLMSMQIEASSEPKKNEKVRVNGHLFEDSYFSATSNCVHCRGLVWGIGKGVQCSECKITLHKKCRPNYNEKCRCIPELLPKSGSTSSSPVQPSQPLLPVASFPPLNRLSKISPENSSKVTILENIVIEDYRLKMKIDHGEKKIAHALEEDPKICSEIGMIAKENQILTEKANLLQTDIYTLYGKERATLPHEKLQEILSRFSKIQNELKEKVEVIENAIKEFKEEENKEGTNFKLEKLVENNGQLQKSILKFEALTEICTELSARSLQAHKLRLQGLKKANEELNEQIQKLEMTKKNLFLLNQVSEQVAQLIAPWAHEDPDQIYCTLEHVPNRDKQSVALNHILPEEQRSQTLTKPMRVDEIVRTLTSEKQMDSLTTRNFLLTFQEYMTPLELFEKLVIRYCVTPQPETFSHEQMGEMKERTQVPVRLRVLNLIKSMIDMSLFGKIPEEQEVFYNFLGIVKATGLGKFAESLTSNLEKKLRKEEVKIIPVFTNPPPPSIIPKAENWNLTDLDPLELTRQITLLESRMYKSIEPSEFVNQAWTSKDKENKAKNILRMTKFFNRVSGWVIHLIVSETDLKKRSERMNWFFAIVKNCYQLHNFNTMFEVLAGLSATSVFRLKKTWEALPSDCLKLYSELNSLLEKNFAGLRELQKKSQNCIPYLGIYLTDLVFLGDSFQTFQENGLINTPKMTKLAGVIRTILDYQQHRFNFSAIDKAQEMFEDLPVMEDKDAYSKSKQLE